GCAMACVCGIASISRRPRSSRHRERPTPYPFLQGLVWWTKAGFRQRIDRNRRIRADDFRAMRHNRDRCEIARQAGLPAMLSHGGAATWSGFELAANLPSRPKSGRAKTRIICACANGFIGGAVASALIAGGHTVRGLVRSKAKADAVAVYGVEAVVGSLDDAALLQAEARAADAVVNAASSDHRGAVEALIAGMSGSGKPLIHSSGSSIV